MIKEATNLDNLAQLYEGWTAWVWTGRQQVSLVQRGQTPSRINSASGIHKQHHSRLVMHFRGLTWGNLGNLGALGKWVLQSSCTSGIRSTKTAWKSLPPSQGQGWKFTTWTTRLSFCYRRTAKIVSRRGGENSGRKKLGTLQAAEWFGTQFHLTLWTIQEITEPGTGKKKEGGGSREEITAQEELRDSDSWVNSCCSATVLVELTR